jgi:hypothetical protein
MKLAHVIDDWKERASEWLTDHANKTGHPLAALTDIDRGVDAWTVAHRAGLTREAYAMGRDINDAHIQTALEKIFPNAVFMDKKRY